MTTSKSMHRVHINAPIDKVWAELTRTDMILPFFFNCRCHTTKLELDAPVRMRSANGKYAAVVGEVLEFDPPHRYSHTFKFTSLDDPLCKVTYDLKEVDGGTQFTLINENVPAGTKTEKYMEQGAKFIAETLKAVVETGKPTFGQKAMLFMMGLSAPFTPAKCRSEHWPMDQRIE